MSPSPPVIRGFRTTFVVIGVLYVMMASSALVRGAEFLADFGVSPELIAEPVLEDFFLFFYELMAVIGVLIVVFGYVAKERRTQGISALALCLANLRFGIRDLSTSDSQWGNQLYGGDETLLFVIIDAILAVIFGYFAWRGLVRHSHLTTRMGEVAGTAVSRVGKGSRPLSRAR